MHVRARFDALGFVDHVAGRVLDRLVLAGANRSEDARAEDDRVADFGERDRHARDVSVHLHPVARLRGAAAGDQLGGLEAGVLEGLEHVGGAVADGLFDGVVDLLRGGGEVEAPHNAACLGVGVGGAVALEVLVNDEATGAGRHVGDALVEDLVGVHSQALGGRGQVAAEVVLEPLEDGTRGDEAAFAGVLARHDAVGVAAEEAFAVERGRALTGDDVRGAGDDGGLAGRYDAEADLTGPGVGATLGDGSAREEAEFLRDRGQQATDGGAEVEDPFGDLLEDVATADVLVELDGPSAFVAVVVHAQGGGVDVEGPLAGELVGQPVRRVHKAVGVLVDVGLVGAQPGCLEGVPLCGRGHGAAAVVVACPVVNRFGACALFGGAHVHPHDRVAQLAAVFVHRDDGHSRRVVGDAGDVTGGDAGVSHDAPHRCDEGVPPVFRALLSPSGVRVIGLVGRCGEGNRGASQVENRSPTRLCAEVDSHEEGAFESGCNHDVLSFLSSTP